jgi:hypothetical protein
LTRPSSVFFETSQFIHSLPQGLRHHGSALVSQHTSSVQPTPRREEEELALTVAAILMLMALNASIGILGADLDADVEAIAAQIKSLP